MGIGLAGWLAENRWAREIVRWKQMALKTADRKGFS